MIQARKPSSSRIYYRTWKAYFRWHVKVYSTMNYKVVHSFDYAASILSLALAPDDEMIVVGMTNGVLNVKHRKPEEKKSHEPSRRKHPSYRMFVKGKDYMPKQDDFIVSKPVRQHLRKYDKLLRGFQVSAALDAALEARSPEVIVAVMNEIERRGTLKNALAGRDEKQLCQILTFLMKYIVDPRFSSILLNVSEKVIGKSCSHSNSDRTAACSAQELRTSEGYIGGLSTALQSAVDKPLMTRRVIARCNYEPRNGVYPRTRLAYVQINSKHKDLVYLSCDSYLVYDKAL
ncbi:unnamed protein product [Ranitomeya imitator]|uniref:U3 small nucleolar RNA-associated protein 15 C-terminal domain-containing protein n=1 Tax=Ranitomeya imitator TaxID=111125 RepID=A0ABN9LAR0_9NEOB|nr:unnamed protein product [Ranitomeya imitator]